MSNEMTTLAVAKAIGEKLKQIQIVQTADGQFMLNTLPLAEAAVAAVSKASPTGSPV